LTGKSKELDPVPIVPAVQVVPNVQFGFINKIGYEAPSGASPQVFAVESKMAYKTG
jgi:hypothetical protein